jgi:hypothetical protein
MQKLARHSDARLTVGRYGRSDLGGRAEAVEALPDRASQDPELMRATMTEGTANCMAHCVPIEGATEGIGRAFQYSLSTPGKIRTCDLRFRKPLLYPLSYEGQGLICLILTASTMDIIHLRILPAAMGDTTAP